MAKRIHLASAAAVLTAVTFAASPAQALVVRAWVSGHGSDVAGCGAPAAPCRTLQYAFTSVVSPGGEIDILDPAGYGTLVIDHAIGIVNDGVGTAGIQAASGAAIAINAGANDAVRLKGLSIEGLGTAADGIIFHSGGSLTIEDCTIRDFNFQIQFAPAGPSDLHISDSRIENSSSGGVGINIAPVISGGNPVVRASLQRVDMIDDQQAGIFIDGRQSTSGVDLNVTIADSFAAYNTSGIHTVSSGSGATVVVMIDGTKIVNNAVTGVITEGGGVVYVGHSTIGGNNLAFHVLTGGVNFSYGDNKVDGNAGIGNTPTAASFH